MSLECSMSEYVLCAGYYTCLKAGDNSLCHRNRENPPSLTENNIRIDYEQAV